MVCDAEQILHYKQAMFVKKQNKSNRPNENIVDLTGSPLEMLYMPGCF